MTKIVYVPKVVQIAGPTVTEYVDKDVAKGRYMIPVSAFKVGDVKGAAVGVGYQFRNRMVLSGQVVVADNDISNTVVRTNNAVVVPTSDFPSHCNDGNGEDGTANSHCLERTTSSRSSSSHKSDNYGRDTGFMLTLTIPLGK